MGSNNDLKQYEIQFPSEYTSSFVKELGQVMQIPIDIEKLNKATHNDGDQPSEETLCIFRNPQDIRCFIIIDCLNNDILYSLVARCSLDIHEEVKKMILKWDTIAREFYRQDIRYDLKDKLSEEDNDLNQILEMYNISI